MLGVLTHEQLEHCMFPLADTPSKAEVRAEAEARGLSVANKPDSHDICFIPDGDTRGWLAERIDMTQGEIVDHEGKALGQHEGAHAFTVGQRKGLKLGRSRRRRQAALRAGNPSEGKQGHRRSRGAAGSGRAARHQDLLGRVADRRGRVRQPNSTAWSRCARTATLSTPAPRCRPSKTEAPSWSPPWSSRMRGVAPGQTMVVYQGTRVLGQATIDSARSAAWDSSLVS